MPAILIHVPYSSLCVALASYVIMAFYSLISNIIDVSTTSASFTLTSVLDVTMDIYDVEQVDEVHSSDAAIILNAIIHKI
jgi:hypothetical protein